VKLGDEQTIENYLMQVTSDLCYLSQGALFFSTGNLPIFFSIQYLLFPMAEGKEVGTITKIR